MEQRPLRLGDILDDYCPRERRVTNHAVVAMIGDAVKQTRCTTCDAEHAFKGGREPRRRKKDDASSALYREVLAGMPDTEVAGAGVAHVAVPAIVPPPIATPEIEEAAEGAVAALPAVALGADDDEPLDDERDGDGAPRVEEGPVHRRLIRATLPRPEGAVKETRPIPEFTMHRPIGRAGQFRGGQHRGNGSGAGQGTGNGHRSHGRRFAGGGGGQGMPGRGGGQGRPGGGFSGGNAPRAGGPKKRSR